MKQFLHLILILFYTQFVFADAVIFSGSDVKTLKSNIDLNGNAKILSGTVDPTSSATSAPVGSIYLNTSTGLTYRKLDSGSSTNWSVVGSGSSEGKNYVTNPDAETGTTGWSTYADAAGTTPVDCTGGSPTTTFTRSTSSPLNGSASFLLTKSASNLQGEGVSIPFTIDAADKAKVLTVTMESIVSSGTYVAGTATTDSDTKIFIYDVTNAAIIEPSTTKFYASSTSLSEGFKSTFQTASNSTSYRLCVHVASTSSSAYVQKLDKITVSPSKYVYGTPVTDWASYTPTFVGLGTPTNVYARWRRVGSDIEISGHFQVGTATAVTASMSLPSVTINTAASFNIGIGRLLRDTNTSSAVKDFSVIAQTGNQTVVNFSYPEFTASSSPLVAGTGTGVFVNSSFYSFDLKAPVVGWSSSVQTSDQTDTRVVSMVATAGSGQSITSTNTQITGFTASSDTHGNFASNQYTIRTPGYYAVYAQITYSTQASAARGLININKNGSAIYNGQQVPLSASYNVSATASTILNLSVGDVIDVYGNATTTTALTGTQYFSLQRVSGPASIAATEKIFAEYNTASASSITSTPAILNYNTKVRDTHGAVTTGAGWVFTAPRPDNYSICAAFRVTSQASASQKTLILYKNGASFRALTTDRNNAGSADDQMGKGCTDTYLKAGEYISVYAVIGTTSTLVTDGAYNWITIKSHGGI